MSAVRGGRLAAFLLMAVAVAGVASGFDALVVEPELRLTVSDVALPPGRLARAMAGGRIVHLSDLHVLGPDLREGRLAGTLNRLAPDLVVITGDYGEGPDGMIALTRLLASVRTRHGIFGVMGNNDYYRGHRNQIGAALSAAGATLLVNEWRRVQVDGGAIVIAGVDDPHYGRDDIEASMKDAPGDLPMVLLAHSPDLLRRKSRGLMINAGDERGPWRTGWFWQDGSHVRPDPGEVRFPSSGRRRLRVQRREDGVGVGEIRLVPMPATAGAAPPHRLGRRNMAPPRHVPGEIVIKAAQVRDEDLHGGWVRRTTEEGVALFDTPDRGLIQSWADVEPVSYFEAGFDAEEGVRYHVWVRLRSANDRGTSDSLYLQFSDSLDVEGRPDYRIGVAMPQVETARVDLMVAGHEHGGQVRLPFVGPLEPNVRLSPYQMGMYKVGTMPLYVSRGIGWSALPVRFWCTPEIVVLESRSEGRDAGSL